MTLSQAIVLAQKSAPPADAPKSGMGMETIFILVLMFAVFYLLILRPQKKRDQKRKEMLTQIRKGDQVRTIGGIFAEVIAVKETYVIVQTDKETDATLKVSRAAISAILNEDGSEISGK